MSLAGCGRITGDPSPAFTGIPGFCAAACTDVLKGIGPFEKLGDSLTPGGLQKELDKLQQSPVPPDSSANPGDFDSSGGDASGGFVLY